MFLLPILTLKENGGFAVAMAFARQAVAAGERVVIVASGFHGTQAVDAPENAGIEFVVVPAIAGGRIGALLAFFVRAIALSIRHRPSIVYTHIATTLIPDFSGRRTFMLAQDIEYRFYSGVVRRLAKWVFARAIRRSDLLVSSLWLARYFRRCDCRIVFAGDVGVSRRLFVDQAANHHLPRAFDFLLIAKRGAHKRRSETLQVAERLAQGGNVVRLIDQTWDGTFEAPAANMVLSGAVSSDVMRELYSQTRVFVGVSKAEGYGLTPLEALSQGCRVVTTPTPSTAQLHLNRLAVVTGSEDLVERLTEAALNAVGRDKDAPGPSGALRIPFMEDWGARAYMAFAGERVR